MRKVYIKELVGLRNIEKGRIYFVTKRKNKYHGYMYWFYTDIKNIIIGHPAKEVEPLIAVGRIKWINQEPWKDEETMMAYLQDIQKRKFVK